VADQAPAQAFPSHAIAVVGLAGRFPDARSLDDFWRNLHDGVESLESFSDSDLEAAGVADALKAHDNYVRKGTVLEGADLFDAEFFGISPREAQILDPQQRVFLECAWEAMEHAGYGAGISQNAVGVYAGTSLNSYLLTRILRNPAVAEAAGAYQVMLGSDKDFLCTRVSYKLDLHGPSMTIQTACSTSLVAVVVACEALNRGECDLALAGGVSITFPQRAGYLYEEGMILSPDGHCRPFDIAARGTRGGSGAGVVVLKRLADASAAGDTIHAVIRGAAINNDGASKAGYTAPSINGQMEVIARAQALAGVDPRTISYVEAHGTATPLGDPIEFSALTQVFRASTPDIGFCRLGSLKANLGHLDAAAGVAGLIKTVLALKHRSIPPLVNFHAPNPQIDLEASPFAVNTSAIAWTSEGGPRRAGVSSFGIGGTNAHVVLEEAPVPVPSMSHRDHHLLVLSGKTAAALEEATSRLAACLDANRDMSLANVAWTLQAGRQAFAHRRMVVVHDVTQAVERLRASQRPPVLTQVHDGGMRPIAFLFTGQGSQHSQMGAGLYRSEPVYRDAIERCADILRPHLGLDIREIVFSADAAINETRLAQPALFATEYALASLWMSWGVKPQAMLGHSIGEYVAAQLAGVLSLDDALAVVAARGRLMQAVPSGSMIAVSAPASDLGWVLGNGVEIAAINATRLCTLAGPGEAIAVAVQRLKAKNIEASPLHTSHAFHSAMMEPALGPFEAVMAGVSLSAPTIPYISNVTGTWITAEQATSPAYYASHLRCPVQFEAGIHLLAADPARVFIEVGPGKALASLGRLILGADRARHVIASLPASREELPDTEAMLEAAGKLWLAGAGITWQDLNAGEPRRRLPLPTYPFERRKYWIEDIPSDSRQVQASAPDRHTSIEQWLYAPTWMRSDALAGRPVSIRGSWLVLGKSGPLTDATVALLNRSGAMPVVVEEAEKFQRLGASRYQVRRGAADDIAALIRDLPDTDRQIAGAIALWDMSPLEPTGSASAESAYSAVVALTEGLAMSARGAPIHIVAASTGAASVLNEPVQNPEAASALGPVLVLPTEVSGLRMRSIDLDTREGTFNAEAAAEALVEEAASPDGETSVARRAGRRWVRRFERLALPPAEAASLPLKPRGAYLITGGLGGIGLQLAQWFATATSARLLLTARRALPPRPEWDEYLDAHGENDRNSIAIRTIREIERTGGEVMTAEADAADEHAMVNAVESARAKWGSLNGVVHAAGIPGNGRLAFLKNGDDVRAVMAPKVDGLKVLIRLLGNSSLDFVALMSSVGAIVGAPGVSEYAAANAVLDAFPESALRPAAWRYVVAIDWGAWRDVGMAANLVVAQPQRSDWETYLKLSIPPAAGVEIFSRILASGSSRIVVSPFDVVQATAQRARILGAVAAGSNAPANPHRAQPRAGHFEPPTTDIERRLAAIWTELLGVEPIGLHDDFFDLGGHSLLGTRVLARIDDALGVQLTLRDVFDAPTIRQLAERIGAISVSGGSSGEAREEIVI
jgi:phthiocerol/phenolphthiocerol synthesis type-I polyketide synthase E